MLELAVERSEKKSFSCKGPLRIKFGELEGHLRKKFPPIQRGIVVKTRGERWFEWVSPMVKVIGEYYFFNYEQGEIVRVYSEEEENFRMSMSDEELAIKGGKVMPCVCNRDGRIYVEMGHDSGKLVYSGENPGDIIRVSLDYIMKEIERINK